MRSLIIKGLSTALLTCGAAVIAAHAEDKPHSYLVFFDFDKSDLTPQALKIIDAAAQDIAAGNPAKIEVTGYTDTVGSEDYNLALSRRRAAAVEAALTKRGVAASEIAVQGMGKHDLLVKTADGVREPQNRRASIVYSLPEAQPAAPAPEAPPPAAEAAAETPAAAPPGFGVWAQLETGILENPDSPKSGLNFGHLFTDKANQVVLNQILLTAERPIDPKATGYDVSYRLQGMYGTDARYTHFLGELDDSIKDRQQLDIVEAWVNVHTPWLTDDGMDIKVGQYVTYLGADTIDPSGSVFYSKNYIFNYGIPLKHTGAMVITHVNDTLDIYTGVDTGVNTTFGNNAPSSAAFQGGIGLNNLADGKLTVLALTHIGGLSPVDDSTLIQTDILLTYKASDTLTSLTEFNYANAEGPNASAYGISETLSYALNAEWTLSGRAEVFDDEKGFFVAAFPGNQDFVLAEKGNPAATVISAPPGRTTYGEFTVGLAYKPDPAGLAPFQAVTLRPELRYDTSLNGTTPFDVNKSFVGTKVDQFTIGLDLILKI